MSGFLWESVAGVRDRSAVAVREREGDVTFGELLDAAQDWVSAFRQAGVEPEVPVLLAAPKTAQVLAAVLALSRVGAPVLIAPSPLSPELMAALADAGGCAHLLVWRRGELRLESRAGGRRVDAELILTTSGSTGAPKLVPLSGTALRAFAGWTRGQFELAPGVSVLSHAPLNFDLSLLDVWSAFAAGGTTILLRADAAATPEAVRAAVREHRPDVVQGVPLLIRLLAHDRPLPSYRHVRHLIVTGEPFPVALSADLRELFPSARWWNVYGATETNDSFIHEVTAADLGGDVVPIGGPLPGVQALLVDDEDTEVTGPGSGELVVTTPFQAHGYLAVPDATAFHRRSGREGTYYRTGDLAERDHDGVYRLRGRTSRTVKVRGVRTNLGQVEDILSRYEPVAEAVVIPVPDPTAGHVLHAVLLPAAGDVDTLALRQHCREHLPLSAIPSRYHHLSSFPRTSSGKVDRTAVKALIERTHP